MARILVIDDEPGILRFMRRALQSHGHTVTTADDGAEGVRLAAEHDPDLVILDLVMPGLSGTAVLAALVADHAPRRVMVVSAAADVQARVACMDGGAVDFLAKPFDIAELLARVRLRLKATSSASAARAEEIVCGTVRLSLRSHRLASPAGEVELSQREFALLEHLMRRSGTVCTRGELLSQVWGYAFDPGSNVVDVTVARLRTKIDGLLIETVRNVGYALQPA